MYRLARVLQLLGLLVTGLALFEGILGGNVRREVLLLGLGAAVFFSGRALEGKRP